jgi:hypothetical protein
VSVTQLSPSLPVRTTRGGGYAHLVIDYGPDEHLMWVVFLDDGGECVVFPNPEVRLHECPSLGRVVRWRGFPPKIVRSDDELRAEGPHVGEPSPGRAEGPFACGYREEWEKWGASAQGEQVGCGDGGDLRGPLTQDDKRDGAERAVVAPGYVPGEPAGDQTSCGWRLDGA